MVMMYQNLLQKIPLYLRGIDLRLINYALAAVVIVLGICALYVLSGSHEQPLSQEQVSNQVYSSPEEEHGASALGDVLPDDSGKNNYVITGERQEASQNFDVQNFDDWGLECVTVVNGKQECHLFQRILWDDNGGEALLAHVLLVERNGKSVPRLRLIAPLGMYLPAGVMLHLGKEKEFVAPFQFCIAGGCFVNLDLADDVVVEINKTEVLHAAYQQPDGTVGSVDISLKGFASGVKALGEL